MQVRHGMCTCIPGLFMAMLSLLSFLNLCLARLTQERLESYALILTMFAIKKPVLRCIALLASVLLCQCKSVAAPGTSTLGDDKRWQSAYSYKQEDVIESETGMAGSWSEKVEEIMIRALSLTGVDYKYGGRSPETGFDCSGFVQYVFKHAAQISLPPSARTISDMGKVVKREDLQPGDLVFFNTLRHAFSHVGIYVGNNQFIHAPRAGAKVRIESMDERYWSTRYNGAKRLENEASAK